MADLLVLPRPAKACRMAQALAEKLEDIGPAEKKEVASVPQKKQLASMPSRLCQKEIKQSRLQIIRWERVKVSKNHTLARERGIRMGGYNGLHSEGRQVPWRKGRSNKEPL